MRHRDGSPSDSERLDARSIINRLPLRSLRADRHEQPANSLPTPATEKCSSIKNGICPDTSQIKHVLRRAFRRANEPAIFGRASPRIPAATAWRQTQSGALICEETDFRIHSDQLRAGTKATDTGSVPIWRCPGPPTARSAGGYQPAESRGSGTKQEASAALG